VLKWSDLIIIEKRILNKQSYSLFHIVEGKPGGKKGKQVSRQKVKSLEYCHIYNIYTLITYICCIHNIYMSYIQHIYVVYITYICCIYITYICRIYNIYKDEFIEI